MSTARVSVRGPVVAGVVGKAAEAVTLVLLATVVPRVLGPVDYGRFAVALTVVAIATVAMTLGGATLLARYVPAAAPGERVALALALSLRLARNRAAVFAVLVVVAVGLVASERVPPVPTAFVLVAIALNVAATLALQADLGLGRAGAWCARYPVQNAVLVVAALALYPVAGATGAVAAIVVAAVVAALIGVIALAPVLRGPPARVALPDGALRFGFLHATSGALTQVMQRGGIVVVALLAGSSVATGYAALAIGVACAATYAVVQLFTVSLPRYAEHAVGHPVEPALRRLAGGLLAVLLPASVVGVLVLDAAVPLVFGAAYAPASEAFGPAMAMVVLAPLNALALQVAALRLRPDATLRAALAGVVAFGTVAVLAVPVWGATGATWAALAGTAAVAAVAVRVLPGTAGPGLTVACLGGAAAVALLGVLS